MNQPVLPVKLLNVGLSACLGLLLVVLMTGCTEGQSLAGQHAAPSSPSQRVAMRGGVGPSVRAAAPVAAPVAAPAAPVAPAALAAPALTPEQIAAAKQLFITQGCIGCHTLSAIPESSGLIGPDLSTLNAQFPGSLTSAAYKSSEGKATNAVEYFRESILAPSAFIYPDCPDGPCSDYVMPQNFKDRIKAADLDLILSFLATLN